MAARRRRSLATTLLAVTTVLFLAAAIGLTVLYLAERTAHDRTKQQLTSERGQLDGVRKELDSTKTKLTAAEQAKRDQEARNAELQECVDATGEFFEAARANDQAGIEQAIDAIQEAC